MITEIVTFPIPEGMTREEVVALYEKSVPTWRANPDLVHKCYLYDPETRRGGGAYLWKSMDAAREGHGAVWRDRILATFGEPTIEYFETPILVKND